MRASLAAEIEVLATQLDRIAQQDRHTADYTRAAIREAIREVIACFPVYRTYVSHRGVSDEDRRIVNWAVNVARKRSVGAELSVFDFLRERGARRARRGQVGVHAARDAGVRDEVPAGDVARCRQGRRGHGAVSLQPAGVSQRRRQRSGPLRHLVARRFTRPTRNERARGRTRCSQPRRTIRSAAKTCAHASPCSASLPDLWKLHVARWTRFNRSKRRQVGEDPAPDREDEYLLYQTLIGVWSPTRMPRALTERLQAYAVKAAREAKRSTSWIAPNAEYEKALGDFIARAARRSGAQRVPEGFPHARANRGVLRAHQLAGADVLKIASPGMPDFYQGTELPALTLVDPDNRRRVDFDAASPAPGRRSSACRDRRASCCGSRRASRASST